MATIQSAVLSVSSLSSFATLSTSSVSPSRVSVKAWTRSTARRGLTIRAGVEGNDSGPAAPTKAPGVSGVEAPLGVYTTTAPIGQKDVPKAERIAYVCNDCGYIYDLDLPFEEQDDATYACPVCTAPKTSFRMTNTSLGEEPYDVTKEGPANSKPDSEAKFTNMN